MEKPMIPPPNVSRVTTIENLNELNEFLDKKWVLLGISYWRETFDEGGFQDHPVYIIGLPHQ